MPTPIEDGFVLVAKDHLRASDTGIAQFQLYAGAAFAYIEAFTGQTWPGAVEAPEAVQVAAMMLMSDMYENREAQVPVSLKENKTVERLLWPYRVF